MPICATYTTSFFKGQFMKLEGEVRIPSGCAISAAISRKGRLFTGEGMIKAMEVMHERSNGLGGGFAAYGIYPDFKDHYAFHIFYSDRNARIETESYLKERFEIVHAEVIPTHQIPEITDVPLIHVSSKISIWSVSPGSFGLISVVNAITSVGVSHIHTLPISTSLIGLLSETLLPS